LRECLSLPIIAPPQGACPAESRARKLIGDAGRPDLEAARLRRWRLAL